MCAKNTKKKKSGKTGLIIAVVLLVLALLLVWILMDSRDGAGDPSAEETLPAESGMPATDPTGDAELMEFNLGEGLTLLAVSKYTGIYMEDGTDEAVSNVLMMIVSNEGDRDIQYAEIMIPTSDGEARFKLSTLPVGEKIVLLEQNRMPWSAEEVYSDVKAENIAVFSEPLSLHEDQLEFQILDGALNVTNVSGENIAGDIVVYYKNAASDLLYGGITYRVRLEGGLKAGEIRQIMANHFGQSGSRIMFATIG